MSGHSKWSTIKRQKGAADAKRSAAFTKLANAVAAAARGGTDPAFNAKLRLAVDRAKTARMPKDNIERAIARGSGAAEGAQLDEMVYEGFAPGGAAVLVHALTDNRNRTVNEIRSVFQRHGGTLGSANSVAWMFAPVGTLVFAGVESREALELAAIEAGAEDVAEEGDRTVVRTKAEQLDAVRAALASKGFAAETAEVELSAAQSSPVTAADRGRVVSLLSDLDDNADVVEVTTNAEIPD